MVNILVMIKKYLFFSILAITSFAIIIPTNTISLNEGEKFSYAIVCTDFCGSKTWDATYLDADLIITYLGHNEDIIVFHTSYNSSTLLERNYTQDYGNFSLTETYQRTTRKNQNTGLFAWQWINDPKLSVLNVSIPPFFLAHAPPEFQSNIFQLKLFEDQVLIEISGDHSIETVEYQGQWIYVDFESDYVIEVISDLNAYYDIESGVIIRMDLEMMSIQKFTGEIPKETIIDAVGSFKMILVLAKSKYVTNLNLLLVLIPLIFLLSIRRKIKRD
ncbi:hypothetical protein [Candidatus Hodarchaeum mangrovi]